MKSSMTVVGALAGVAMVIVACSAKNGTEMMTSCATDEECKNGQTCDDGVCITQKKTSDAGTKTGDSGVTPQDDGGVCGAPGTTCAGSNDCCQSGSKSPNGAVCLSDDKTCHAKCTQDKECASGCCAALQGGGGACAATNYCQPGGIGDSCANNNACGVGTCAGGTDGWCTKTCQYSTPDCNGAFSGKNRFNQNNWCVKNSGGSNTCFPGCSTNADCSWFPGTTCQSASTTLGTSVKICSH